MANVFFTRSKIQEILSNNPNNTPCSYMERENTNPTKEDINSPNDYIVYLPLSYNYIKTDDVVHIRASTIRIYYFHKLKLNKLDKFIREKFNILGTGETEKNLDTDYFMNYYDFNILTNDDW